jgi:hypothetical protein
MRRVIAVLVGLLALAAVAAAANESRQGTLPMSTESAGP